MKKNTTNQLLGVICAFLTIMTGQACGAAFNSNFEDLGLAAGSFWNGSDLSGGFQNEWARFRNTYDTDFASWSGFAYSSVHDTNTPGYGNQYAVWTPGADVEGTYAVVYDSAWDEQDIIHFPLPVCVKGVHINNTTYAALSMRDGDLFSKKFGGSTGNDPDWFKLTITGKDRTGASQGSVEVFLADYRFTNNALDTIVGEWTWVDLTSLGPDVRTLHFSLSSTDNGAWGMNTPAYFAMDNLTHVPRPSLTLTADLEALSMPGDGYWNGSDLSGGFHSEWAHFRNTYDTNFSSWSGFAYSSVLNTNTPGYDNQYAVWTPGMALNGTGTYAVVYDSAWDEQDIVTLASPALVNGLHINNTTYAALAMRDGDAFSKKFGGLGGDDPDWFKLAITGKNQEGGSLGTVEVYLADYRFTNNALDYILGDWTWIDLTPLGPTVKTLHFSLSSTDNGAWGMNTPAYFAVDSPQFQYTFSAHTGDGNLFDSPVPGFVGPDGNGNSTGTNNYVNPAFAGWAAEVIEYAPAPGVTSQWANAGNALGPVTGTNTHIVSLGDLDQGQINSNIAPGRITLRMDPPIADKDGPDLAVFENTFGSSSAVFGELGYVEVSSDGTNFVRFPGVSLTADPVEAYGTFAPRHVYNLCGKHANASGVSWGTPFDLSDLACHPDVRNGAVTLTNVTYVRIVDIPGSGDFFDSSFPSNPIYDPWKTITSGGVDLEAVGVINSPNHARIATTTIGPGSISPYGMPKGTIAVPHGSNLTLAITPDPGHHIIDVLVNGVSQGPVTNVPFVNVTADQCVTAQFGNILVVDSLYGTHSPGAGTNYAYGLLTANQTGSPVIVGATQYVCVGWAGTGSVLSNGIGTSTTFTLTNDSTLSWLWTTNYWLDIETLGQGRVDRTDAWHAQGQSIPSTATADPYYDFVGWTGNVQGDTNAVAMTVAMDHARQLTARFWADLATNNVPKAWLTAHHHTNGTPDQEATSDWDFDGRQAWEEWFAGTDPNNPTSVFDIVEFGMENTSNYVVWIGGTNGSTRPFAVMGSTNLLHNWTELDGQVAHADSGTNTWWHTPSHSNFYYRIQINTEN